MSIVQGDAQGWRELGEGSDHEGSGAAKGEHGEELSGGVGQQTRGQRDGHEPLGDLFLRI